MEARPMIDMSPETARLEAERWNEFFHGLDAMVAILTEDKLGEGAVVESNMYSTPTRAKINGERIASNYTKRGYPHIFLGVVYAEERTPRGKHTVTNCGYRVVLRPESKES